MTIFKVARHFIVVSERYFANRSDFVTQAMLFFIERKREEMNLDKLLPLDIDEFYKFMFRKKEE